MSFDIRDNIIVIYRYQSFDNIQDHGIAYEEGTLRDLNEISQCITILEIIKQNLLAKFDRLGKEIRCK